jgi:cytochrome-b5 reductase
MALKTLVFTFRNAPAPVQIVLASMGCASAVGAAVWMKRCYSVSAEEGSTSGALHPNEFRRFKLREIERISYNTARYRFDLPKSDDVLGLTVASCLVVRAPIGENGKDVIRPYTPVTLIDQHGFFDLLVKSYPLGVMSKHIASLTPGDELEFKGPFKKIDVIPNMKRHIGMIAGGTGK